MFVPQHIDEGYEELASRESNGVSVWLLWNRRTDTAVVSVFDSATETAFTIDIGDASPMDVFHHPYAYAAFRGVDSPDLAAELGLQAA